MPLRPELRAPDPPELLRRFFGPALDQQIESWDEATLREYQRAAIAEQLEHAYQNNEFYRAKFDLHGTRPSDFRSLDDLARFPFTEKSELLRDPWLLLAVPREEVRLIHTSTGTTGGDWSYQLYTWEDLFLRDVVPMPWSLLGIRPGDVVVNALPYEMSSAGQSFQRSLQAGAGAVVVPVGKGGYYSDPEKTARVLGDVKADVLITTPPYAMQLHEAAIRCDVGELRLRQLWLTGEGCSGAYRKRLGQLWGCDPRVFYGSLECGPIGLDDGPGAAIRVCAGHVYLEIVDPKTGKPQPHGQMGEIVCTVLQRKASPLIRFRLRDLGYLDAGPCPRGLALPGLHLRGRIVDQVPGEEESVQAQLSPLQIEEVLYRDPEMGGNYQIYLGSKQTLVIDVELNCPSERTGAVLDRMRRELGPVLEQAGYRSELHAVGFIPRSGGKTRRIRPLRDRPTMPD